MNDKNHPIWPLLRLVVMMASLTALLWLNASHFDATEVKTIIGMLIANVAAEGVPGLFRKGEG